MKRVAAETGTRLYGQVGTVPSAPLRDIAVFFFCIGFCVAIAWPHFSGEVTFIGDSDRLNSFLNIKLGEATSLHELGRVASWTERNLMGFSLAGAYWMLPGAYPDAWLHARLPLDSLLRDAGYVTFFLLALALFAAYLLLVDICKQRLAAMVGAVVYASSAFSLSRLAQVDPAFATLIAMPVGLLALRRSEWSTWRPCLLTLAATIAAMCGLGFLQEVAYAMILMGAYALYRAFGRQQWWPLVVLVAASIAGLIIAAPRVITVFGEFALMARTSSLQGVTPEEVLRFFAEGIYGRFHGEAKSVGNGINLHEGLLIGSSTTAALYLFCSLPGWNPWRHGVAAAVFLASFAFILDPIIGMESSILLAALLAVGCLVLGDRVSGRRRDTVAIGGDLDFFLYFLTFVLAVVLVPEARWLFHQAFLRIDFLHSRFTIAGLIPFAACISLALARDLADEKPVVRTRRGWTNAASACAAGAVAAAVLATVAVAPGSNVPASLKLTGIHGRLIAPELIKVAVACMVLLLAFLVLRRWSRVRSGKALLALFVGSLIIGECLAFSRLKLFGAHTHSYPVAFKDSNYFNAPAGVFHPPTYQEREHWQQRLSSSEYRTITVADAAEFPAFVAPHIAEFYGLRLADGYPILPKMIAELPWPGRIAQLRSISFRSESEIPWRLLSVLNVRQALIVDRDFYYNTPRQQGSGPTVIDNPHSPLPRHYFAASVERPASRLRPIEGFNASTLSPGEIELRWWKPFGDTRVVVERRERGDRDFALVREIDALSEPNVAVLSQHKPGASYIYRLRETDTRGNTLYSTGSVEVEMPVAGVPRPVLFVARRVSRDEIELAWDDVGPNATIEIEMQRGQGGEFVPVPNIAAGRNALSVSGVPDDASYTFRIRAAYPEGRSPHSQSRSVGNERFYGADLAEKLFGNAPLHNVFAEGLESRNFTAKGRIEARYGGDRIIYDLEPLDADRFLVANELYHPRWKAYAGESELTVYRTNQFMRGILVPAGVTRVEMRYEPFLASRHGIAIAVSGALLLAVILLLPLQRLRGAATISNRFARFL